MVYMVKKIIISSSALFTFSHAEIDVSGGDEGTSSSESGESDDEPGQTMSRRWLLCCFKGNYKLNGKYRSLLRGDLTPFGEKNSTFVFYF